MIHMPRRSVTRFFIPLIDVLLLLFCIFLLMPIGAEDKMESALERNSDLAAEVDTIGSELERRSDDLEQYKENLPDLHKIKELKDEIERLKRARRKNLQERTAFYVIDIDGKTGGISYTDANQPEGSAPTIISNKEEAKKLIQRHKKEAGEQREVYYYFLYPRPKNRNFPTIGQLEDYAEWFAGVANSLKEY